MGRTAHIQPGAKGTTVYFTKAQKVAVRKFQAKRLEETDREPTLTEVVVEGLKLLLSRDGWTAAELEQIFPKAETRTASVSVFPKKMHRPRPTV